MASSWRAARSSADSTVAVAHSSNGCGCPANDHQRRLGAPAPQVTPPRNIGYGQELLSDIDSQVDATLGLEARSPGETVAGTQTAGLVTAPDVVAGRGQLIFNGRQGARRQEETSRIQRRAQSSS